MLGILADRRRLRSVRRSVYVMAEILASCIGLVVSLYGL